MTIFRQGLHRHARLALTACRNRNLRVVTAESCTGGLIAASLTDIPGSSDVFERGVVTYSNQAKTELLGVPEEVIAAHGAVSEPVARAMAEGALAHSPADIAVAVTGIAGPGGGSTDKPVGLVHFAAARRGSPTEHREAVFPGDRTEVRKSAAITALGLIATMAGEKSLAGHEKPSRPNGIDVAVVFAGLVASLGVAVLAVVALLMATAALQDAGSFSGWYHATIGQNLLLQAVLLTMIQVAAILGAVYVVGKGWRGVAWSEIGFRPTTSPRRWYVIAVAVGVIGLPLLAAGISSLLDALGLPVVDMKPFLSSAAEQPLALAAMVVLGAVLGPLTEEILFRGYLYTWARRRFGVPVAMVGSSVVFGLAHVSPGHAIATAVIGMVIAMVYERSGSLWPAVVVHGSYNGVALLTVVLTL